MNKKTLVIAISTVLGTYASLALAADTGTAPPPPPPPTGGSTPPPPPPTGGTTTPPPPTGGTTTPPPPTGGTTTPPPPTGGTTTPPPPTGGTTTPPPPTGGTTTPPPPTGGTTTPPPPTGGTTTPPPPPIPGTPIAPPGSTGTPGSLVNLLPPPPPPPVAPTGGFDPTKSGFNPAGFSASNISGLVASNLKPDQFAQLPPDAVKGFSPTQLGQLPPDAVAGLNAQQVANLPPTAMQGFTQQQIQKIDPSLMQGFGASQIANLQPKAVAGLTASQVANLKTDTFQQMPPKDVAEFLVNLNTTNIPDADVQKLLPANWNVTGDGTILPPAGTPLALPPKDRPTSIPSGVTLPTDVPDLSKGFGAGGKGQSALTGLNDGLKNAGFAQFTFQQNQDGILNVSGSGQGQSFAFLPNTQSLAQGNSNESGLSTDKNGFIVVTTPNGQKTPLIPAPKDSEKLLGAINSASSATSGNVVIGSSGDVTMNIPGSNVTGTGIFSPTISQAPAGSTPGVSFRTGADGNPEGLVVYQDGTSQTFKPTTPKPDDFAKTGLKIPGVQALDYQADGTFRLTYQGQTFKLTPDFTLANSTPNTSGVAFDPQITAADGKVKFTVEVGGNIVESTIAITPQ